MDNYGYTFEENGTIIGYININSEINGYTLKQPIEGNISLNQSLAIVDSPTFNTITVQDPLVNTSVSTKNYTDNQDILFASLPQTQFILGSMSSSTNENCSLAGGVPIEFSTGCGLSFGKSGKLTPISISCSDICNVYFVLNNDYISFEINNSIAFNSTDIWSIYINEIVTSTWNIIVSSNLSFPTLYLPNTIKMEYGETPNDITVTSSNGTYPIIWNSSISKFFTDPITYESSSMILQSLLIGPMNTSLYFRALTLLNNTYIYSNVYYISIASYDPMGLGASSQFTLFSSSGAITNTGLNTTYNDHIGVNDGLINGLSGPNQHVVNEFTNDTVELLPSFYNTLLSYTGNSHVAGFIDGEILFPGYYSIPSAASMPTGTLTLDGNGSSQSIFVIQISGAFSIAAGGNILLINGADAFNVYWSIGGALSVGANSNIGGTYICQAGAIAIGADSIMTGRYFTMFGAITLSNITFTNITHF
jgi:hypothetical protein